MLRAGLVGLVILVGVSLAGSGAAVAAVSGDIATATAIGEPARVGVDRPAAGTGIGTAAARQERPNLTVFVAPGDTFGTLRTGNEEAYEAVTRTRRPRVTPADALVLRLSAPDFDPVLADYDGDSLTEQFLALLETDRASLRGTEIRTAGNRTAGALDLRDEEAVTVRRRAANTVELIADPSALNATLDENGNGLADDGNPRPVEPGEIYRLSFTFENATVEQSLAVFAPVATIGSEDGGPVVYPVMNQRITGETTIAPGSTVDVSLNASGGAFRTEQSVRATGPRSRIDASFDLRSAPDDVPLLVTVTRNGTRIGRAVGRIGPLTGSFAADSAVGTPDRLVVREVSFSRGGFLVVRDSGGDGRVVGNRYVEPGDHDSLTVRFAGPVESDAVRVTAYVDIDGGRVFDADGPDRPYQRNGEPMAATVRIAERTETSPRVTTAPTTTNPRGNPPTPSPAPTVTAPRDTTFTSYTITHGAGLGAGVAVVALALAAALFARRR